MAVTFTVHGANGQSVRIVGTYKVLDHGVLGVKPNNGRPFIMSPSAWAQVDIDDAPDSHDLLSAGGDASTAW